jgi:hypothetical protein
MRVSRYIFLIVVLLGFTLPLAAQVNDTYVIPVVGNTGGANNTRWMSQVSVFNPQAYGLVVSITYLPTLGGPGTEKLFTVPANSTVSTDNVLSQWFNGVGTSGALLVATFPEDNPGVSDTPIARSFLVTSDTYNLAPNLATFSQTIPGVWAGLQDYDTDGISAIVHGIRNISAQGWRCNIGAVNVGDATATLWMNVYDSAGRLVQKDVPLNLPPRGHIQQRLPVSVDRGSVEFFLDDPTQRDVVFAYASTIDELSGDPRYQTPVLLATAHRVFGKGKPNAAATLVSAGSFVGRKIDNATAREVRASANREGMMTLVKSDDGSYRVQQ